MKRALQVFTTSAFYLVFAVAERVSWIGYAKAHRYANEAASRLNELRDER